MELVAEQSPKELVDCKMVLEPVHCNLTVVAQNSKELVDCMKVAY